MRKDIPPYLSTKLDWVNVPDFVRDMMQTAIDRTAAAEAQNHRCCYCSRKTDAFGPKDLHPTLEHIVPRVRGGRRRHPLNHAMACYRCNQRREEKYIEAETLVPPEARLTVGEQEFSHDSRLSNRPSGFQWTQPSNDHVLVLQDTGEAIGSYRAVQKNKFAVRVAATHLLNINSKDNVLKTGYGTQNEAIRFLEKAGQRFVQRRAEARAAYKRAFTQLAYSRPETV